MEFKKKIVFVFLISFLFVSVLVSALPEVILKSVPPTSGGSAITGTCPSGQFVQNITGSGLQCAVTSGSGDITGVYGDDIYIYNGSASGEVVLMFNETQLNLTIDARSGGAESDPKAYNGTLAYNSSLANYYPLNNPYSYLNSSTETLWNGNYSTFLTHINWATAMNGTLFKSSQWNATNTSYYLVTNPFGFYNSSTWNNPYSYWNSTFANFNKTYADTLYLTNSSNFGNCTAGQHVFGFSGTGVKICTSDSAGSETDPLWSANYTLWNSTWSSTYNATYNTWAYNQTIPAVNQILGYSYYNSTNPPTETLWNGNYSTFLTKINWSQVMNGTLFQSSQWNATNTSYYLTTNPYTFWNSTFATFNKTYGDTLYSPIGEPKAYNGSLLLSSQWNATNTSYLVKSGDTMTGNLNMSTLNVTFISTSTKIYTNTSCVKIQGATSTLEIC